jgi:Zn-dependent M28 family amino/carboxypeptidase
VPRQAIVANLNFDMFLPLYPFKLLTVIGLEESTLGDVAREVAAAREIMVQSDPEPQRNSFVRSDQYSFVRQGIPAIAFKVGYRSGTNEEVTFKRWLRERYHAPSDDIHQPVDRNAAVEFNRLIAAVAEAVANRESAPAWKKTERTASPE